MKRIMAIVTVLAMLLVCNPFALPVSAEPNKDQVQAELERLEEEKAKIDAALKNMKVQSSDNMSQIEKLVAEKAVVDQEIALLYDKLLNINDQIAVYSHMIAQAQAELDAAQAQLEELQLQYRDRIRAIEKTGKLTYWSVIFQANSFSDFLDRLNMVQEIEKADRARLEKLTAAAQKVEQTREELEIRKENLVVTRQQLLQTQEQMDEKRRQSDAKLQELLDKGVEYEKYIEEQEKLAAELAGKIDEKEGLLEGFEKEEYDKWQDDQKPEGGNQVDGATWLIPINYTYVASPYGMRIHPLDGDWRMHNGVDLDAPLNTPIYASRSGVVYYRGWWGTGENTIMINHQDGYISRYLHMERFAVANGEWVAAGQLIGYCGSTGGSSGPHLHFEIQKNGSYVNPAKYLGI